MGAACCSAPSTHSQSISSDPPKKSSHGSVHLLTPWGEQLKIQGFGYEPPTERRPSKPKPLEQSPQSTPVIDVSPPAKPPEEPTIPSTSTEEAATLDKTVSETPVPIKITPELAPSVTAVEEPMAPPGPTVLDKPLDQPSVSAVAVDEALVQTRVAETLAAPIKTPGNLQALSQTAAGTLAPDLVTEAGADPPPAPVMATSAEDVLVPIASAEAPPSLVETSPETLASLQAVGEIPPDLGAPPYAGASEQRPAGEVAVTFADTLAQALVVGNSDDLAEAAKCPAALTPDLASIKEADDVFAEVKVESVSECTGGIALAESLTAKSPPIAVASICTRSITDIEDVPTLHSPVKVPLEAKESRTTDVLEAALVNNAGEVEAFIVQKASVHDEQDGAATNLSERSLARDNARQFLSSLYLKASSREL